MIRTGIFFGLLNAGVALWALWLFRGELRRFGAHALACGLTIVLLGVAMAGANRVTSWAEDRFYGDNILYSETSDYQRVVVTAGNAGVRLFLNGNLQFHSRDEYRYHEALVHPVMASVAEPRRVLGLIQRDPEFKTDTLTTAVLDFPNGHSTFTCSTRLAPYQRMIFHGTAGRIEVVIPFNAPNDRPTQIILDDDTIEIPICDQYEIQGTLFSQALRENTEQPIPLEDAINNMTVIDAVFKSASTGQWEEINS